ncbi:MAG: aldehyde dehydrogenase family protein, partial [Armatimonadetes bacterium]|nr:aldehyde dehydrogenase family protein [Armatimonadota bacterium]
MTPPGEWAHLPPVPILVGGRWETVRAERWGLVFNPSTGEPIAGAPLCSPPIVDRAVQAAAAAFPAWADTPAVERARVMFRFRELLQREKAELARLVSREHGKTWAEAAASIQRGIEVVEFSCGLPSLLAGQHVENLAAGLDCSTVRTPLGVCVGISPFNFPVMVPLWMIPVALTCGNTFVLKPSERTPLSAVRLGELLAEAGLPDGVFNLVHGDQECAEALLQHPEVRAVSFVGSTRVARHVYEVANREGKRVQAGGGAKNHLYVLPDADLERAVEGIAAAAYGCAGERCMAGSVAVPVGGVAEEFVERLVRHAGALSLGRTDRGADVDLGPLISAEHRDRVADHLTQAAQEGARLALDGRERRSDGSGFFLGPSV